MYITGIDGRVGGLERARVNFFSRSLTLLIHSHCLRITLFLTPSLIFYILSPSLSLVFWFFRTLPPDIIVRRYYIYDRQRRQLNIEVRGWKGHLSSVDMLDVHYFQHMEPEPPRNVFPTREPGDKIHYPVVQCFANTDQSRLISFASYPVIIGDTTPIQARSNRARAVRRLHHQLSTAMADYI